MSENLFPWIADYLINIAETYGCNISNLPVHLKPGKKIQLIQFLTFRQFTGDDCIWAYVSDKRLRIPVRFSQRAIAEYEIENPPDSQGSRLTQQRCAIATIKAFKPMFQRVPTGQVGKMSVLETIALNVDHIQIVGAAGEPEFGSPRTLDTHSDLNEWTVGLRAGDGSGNVLKLRKEKKLAQERGESSVTETLTSHEQRGYWSGRRVDDILSENHGALSERKAHAEQDDWRESIAKKPLRFYKRPTGNGVTASKPTPTGPTGKTTNPAPPIKRIFKSGKGPLDLDSSPAITQGTDNGNSARSERQTTPSEWPGSPELCYLHPSPTTCEAAGVLPISPPSTPPLLTPEQLQVGRARSAQLSEPAPNHSPEASPETIHSNRDSTSLRVPTLPQDHRLSLPPSSSESAYPSALVTTSPQNRATSLPSDVIRPTVSHARRVPPRSVKNTKEARGEILVPGSDSGGPDKGSLSNKIDSPVDRRRAKLAASPGYNVASTGVRSSPERVHDTHNGRSPMAEPEASQELNNAQLDDLSRMAVNGSYTEQHRGNGVRTHIGTGHGEGDTSPGYEQSYEPLPPSSPPIHSQALSWSRSTVLVEETPALEESLTHGTGPHPPSLMAKRTRSSSPPPMKSKRPRLVSREPVIPSHQVHGTTPKKSFDPELLKVGIEVDLSDYDDSPPPYPWGKGMSRLDFRPSNDSLLITNSKLADIWKSICKYRGWYEESGSG